MSDPFSITAGAIGIATAFTACIDCFNYVQLGRHFGRDFQTCSLLLACAKIRLARWGEAVHIDKDPMLNRLDATFEETQMAKEALLQILILFADTEKISKRHKLSAKAGADLTILKTNELDLAIAALSNQMKKRAIKRQKTSNLFRLTGWAIYQRVEFQELITNITSLIENLENLFPAPKSQLKKSEERIQNGSGLLLESPSESLGVTSCNVDYRNQAAPVLPGHYYTDLAVDGKAQIGDSFSDNWGGTRGVSHRYDGVQVCRNGKALIGNKFGGKGFWDN
ncbi:small s protein [Xylaria scruposa]|nr:small s protein [Xylaria scruposa]